MTADVTALLSFDGTFSSDAVGSAAHRLVQQLHDEAMATIAGLAEHWDQPVAEAAPADDEPVSYADPASWLVADDEPVSYADPASWSVADDDDEQYREDDDVRVLPVLELPVLLPRPGRATAIDRFAVPAERQLSAG